MVYYPPNDAFFRVKKIISVEYANSLDMTEHDALPPQPNSMSQRKTGTIRIKKTKVNKNRTQ